MHPVCAVKEHEHSKKHYERRKFRISSYFLVYGEHGLARNHETVLPYSDVDNQRRYHLQCTDHKILIKLIGQTGQLLFLSDLNGILRRT